MKKFIHYQESKGYSKTTIRAYLRHAIEYVNWVKSQGHQCDQLSYEQLLDYIGYLQGEGKSKNAINTRLRAISHYHRCHEWEDVAHDVRLRGVKSETTLLLTESDLETIYEGWDDTLCKNYYRHSNKLILGLIIYQGLMRADIHQLELDHLNLEKGTLHVPGRLRQREARVLPLVPHQILPFYEYLRDHRAKDVPGRMPKPDQSAKLLSPNCDHHYQLEEQFKWINHQLKEQYQNDEAIPFVKVKQLQQSRIAIWIRQYGIRKAQYMGGFRSVGSVETYRDASIEELKKQVQVHHPLNQ